MRSNLLLKLRLTGQISSSARRFYHLAAEPAGLRHLCAAVDAVLSGTRCLTRVAAAAVWRPAVTAMLAAALALGAVDTLPDPPFCQETTTVTVFHTNDLHSSLASRVDGVEPVGGIARIAGLLRRARAIEPYVIVLDAGDFLFGTPFHTFYGGRAEIECMNAVGYDAVTVGNHELDKGVQALLDLIAEANFTFMSANLRWRDSGERVFEPYCLFETEDVTIAVLALTTGGLHGRVRPSSVAPLEAMSPIETARDLVPALRRDAQAVVVLSHIGVEQDQALAREVPGIDLIIGGDSHTLLEHPIEIRHGEAARPTYICQVGSQGRYLGRVDMVFVDGALSEIEANVIPVRSVLPQDQGVKKIVSKYWNSMEKTVTVVVGQAEGSFRNDRGLRFGESPLGNLIADITRHATGADFAIQNAAGIRAGFTRGPITIWDVYQALPFDNRLLKVELSGAQVEMLADDIARRLGRGSFCQVSGISFEIRSGKAYDVRVKGALVDRDRMYTLGVIDYLAEGGDHYEILTEARVLSSTSLFQRDVAVQYLRNAESVRPVIEGRIRVADTR